MAHSEACQLFIEEQIKEGLEAGKTPYSIGKELTAMIERLFEASIPAETLKKRAQRMQAKIGTNVPIPPTSCNPPQIPEKQNNQQVTERQQEPGPGRNQKYEKPPQPFSCAMTMASCAIDQLKRIPGDDPNRLKGFQRVIAWIEENS